MQNEQMVKKLNSDSALVRKLTIDKIRKCAESDELLRPAKNECEANLNIHTYSSFSPYTPALAAYMAYRSGLKIAGVCDYGSTASAKEFTESCKTLGIRPIVGVEILTKDEEIGDGVVSIYCTGKRVDKELNPLIEKFRQNRLKTVKSVTDSINKSLKKIGVQLDLDKDVLPLSRYYKGGFVSLKHVFRAMGEKLIKKYGKGQKIENILRTKMGLVLSEEECRLLQDDKNPFYIYDLLCALRNNYSEVIDEKDVPKLDDILAISKKTGMIVSYQLSLKNITNEQLLTLLTKVSQKGFNAVSFMHTETDKFMIGRICKSIMERNMLPILLDKVEYPRNKFDHAGIPTETMQLLNACAYAIVGHASCIEKDVEDGIFSEKTCKKCADLRTRIKIFESIGREDF